MGADDGETCAKAYGLPTKRARKASELTCEAGANFFEIEDGEDTDEFLECLCPLANPPAVGKALEPLGGVTLSRLAPGMAAMGEAPGFA